MKLLQAMLSSVALACAAGGNTNPTFAFEVDGFRMGMPRAEVERQVRAVGGSFIAQPERQPPRTGRALFDAVYDATDRPLRTLNDAENFVPMKFYFCRDALVGIDRALNNRGFSTFARIAELESAVRGKAEATIRNREAGSFGLTHTLDLRWNQSDWWRTLSYSMSPSVPNSRQPREDVFEAWFATRFCRES